MSWEVRAGDCVEAMRAMEEGSVDAIVTDPPYGLEFMGKEWDRLGDTRQPGDATFAHVDNPYGRGKVRYGQGGSYGAAADAPRAMQEWHEAWAREALRVLKPGGHLLAFGGTRTSHRLVCAIEDAGFEIRDTIAWLYGSGFPKSLDVGKAIDKAAGAEREVVGRYQPPNGSTWNLRADESRPGDGGTMGEHKLRSESMDITAPATPDAERWQGWGTALKPAHEPIVVARKPLAGTVTGNVLAHGTGALNVDACRIGVDDAAYARNHSGDRGHAGTRPIEGCGATALRQGGGSASDGGRWPANVALDPDAAAMLDEQTGVQRDGVAVNRNREPGTMTSWLGTRASKTGSDMGYGGSGGASRFFYVAKSSPAERNAGVAAGLPRARSARKRYQQDAAGRWVERAVNRHPTVKPVELMRWLVRLVAPPGGVVLDPFVGSGTTGCAAVLEGFEFVGFEREMASVVTARARIAWWSQPRPVLARRVPPPVAEGQLGLLDGGAS